MKLALFSPSTFRRIKPTQNARKPAVVLAGLRGPAVSRMVGPADGTSNPDRVLACAKRASVNSRRIHVSPRRGHEVSGSRGW